MRQVLWLDDELDASRLGPLFSVLRNGGFEFATTTSGKEAIARLRSEAFDVLVLDLHLASGADGLLDDEVTPLQVARAACRAANPPPHIVVLSYFLDGFGDHLFSQLPPWTCVISLPKAHGPYDPEFGELLLNDLHRLPEAVRGPSPAPNRLHWIREVLKSITGDGPTWVVLALNSNDILEWGIGPRLPAIRSIQLWNGEAAEGYLALPRYCASGSATIAPLVSPMSYLNFLIDPASAYSLVDTGGLPAEVHLDIKDVPGWKVIDPMNRREPTTLKRVELHGELSINGNRADVHLDLLAVPSALEVALVEDDRRLSIAGVLGQDVLSRYPV